jgi:hypothetical protein
MLLQPHSDFTKSEIYFIIFLQKRLGRITKYLSNEKYSNVLLDLQNYTLEKKALKFIFLISNN